MIQKPRGTQDLFNDKALIYEKIVSVCICVVKKYNYKLIKTPIFEDKDLFLRSIGEETDIVNKELFLLKSNDDKDNLALRPEGTASVMRSVIENKLYQNQILRFFYLGSMFRYERPQKGRFREFSQFGIEALGSESYLLDAEVILIAINILKKLNINDVTLKINNLGTIEERKKYLKDLVNYLNKYKDQLCPDCQRRLLKNPLRILDCKIEANKAFINNVPNLFSYLSEKSKNDFNKILKILTINGIKYEISNKLVRGLDYYQGTIFEIEANSGLGAQATLIGGGRYNKLAKILGNDNDIESMGFALGIERMILFLQNQNLNKICQQNLDCFFISLSDKVEPYLFKIWNKFSFEGLKCSRIYSNDFKNQCSKANKENSNFLIILGEKDLANMHFTLQNNKTSKKQLFSLDSLDDCINYIRDNKNE